MTSRFPARTTSDLSVSSWGKPASAGIGVVAGYGVATGGSSSSITVGGLNYTLLTFTTSSTLTVTASGLFDIAIVAGGGSGAGPNTTNYGGGGGGGGGLMLDTVYLTANQTVTVGAGGAGVTGGADGNQGTASRIGDLVATGGGWGAVLSGRFSAYQSGSGGGNGNNPAPGQGNAGGGANGATPTGGGGGGGYAAAGSNGSQNIGGAGGAGYDISAFISGSSYFVSAGGGGAGWTIAGGAAGSVGAGAGGRTGIGADSATRYGCGGGGNATTGSSGNGFQGVVYVRFRV